MEGNIWKSYIWEGFNIQNTTYKDHLECNLKMTNNPMFKMGKGLE
jgi:hypothetical protein